MRKYRTIDLKDFSIVKEKKDKKFKNTMIRNKETGDVYVIYYKVQGEKSNGIIRVNPTNICRPDRGTYTKIKGKYYVALGAPAFYK